MAWRGSSSWTFASTSGSGIGRRFHVTKSLNLLAQCARVHSNNKLWEAIVSPLPLRASNVAQAVWVHTICFEIAGHPHMELPRKRSVHNCDYVDLNKKI